jgi:hypothetical protein
MFDVGKPDVDVRVCAAQSSERGVGVSVSAGAAIPIFMK